MLKEEDIKYIEKQIKETISAIYHQHYQIVMQEQYDSNYVEEYPGRTYDWIRRRLRDVYHLILTYLEANQLPLLSENFISKFSDIISDDILILKEETIDPEGESELIILSDFERFISPFKNFDYIQEKDDEKKKLISILRNTGYILKNLKTTFKNEADIYKAVKWVLSLYYPSCRSRQKAAFIHEFKTYSPDILIPELKIAIEYKYLNNAKDNIDEFIDQIKVDATNYINDPLYDTFIAVIYIENIEIVTPEMIKTSWKTKQFPNNWILVITENSTIISPEN